MVHADVPNSCSQYAWLGFFLQPLDVVRTTMQGDAAKGVYR